ncbi:MAG TPA: serine protease [Candidatus Binatia bacterium]|nr:serine protease [Candidatus Binatia bacterium]
MRRRSGSLATLIAVAVSSAVLGGAAGAIFASRARPPAAEPVSAATVTALASRDIALRSFASVVLVSTQDAKGRPLSFGSGFVVKEGVVLTNLHVLKGCAAGTVRLIGDGESARIAGAVASDPSLDLVLLSVPTFEAAPLPLGDSSAVSIGDRVFVVSNPQDLEGTFSEGIISGKRKRADVRLLQITAPISAGSSGGPVLDANGRVIGVATSSLKTGQNLNFAITAEYVEKLMQATGEVRQLAKVAPPPDRPIQTARAEGFFQRLGRVLHLR